MGRVGMRTTKPANTTKKKRAGGKEATATGAVGDKNVTNWLKTIPNMLVNHMAIWK